MDREKEREKNLYGVVLGCLMLVRDVRPQQLGALAKVSPKLISNYQRCLKPLKRSRLDLFAAAMGYLPGEVEEAISWVEAKRAGLAARRGMEGSPGAGRQGAAEAIELLGQEVQRFARQLFDLVLREGSAAVARQHARQAWEKLHTYTAEERRLLAEQRRDLWSWALCELLCQESIDAAADDADKAVELANLALTIAEHLPGDEALREETQGFAWAHVGNATRVKGDLNGADRAFAQFRRFWRHGEGPKSGLLSEALVLGLEASLRRAQRKFALALDLLNQALALCDEKWTPHLLNNKARVFMELGDYEEALRYLKAAEAQLLRGEDLRFRWGLKWNRAWCLSQLERFGEAAALLPEIWAYAQDFGGALDLARLHLFKGRVAAGLGKSEEALAACLQAREMFLAREMAYDAALASLEMAALYLNDGRTDEVKKMVGEMEPVFRNEGVHREALVAVQLFCDAVRHETATAMFARRVTAYLYRAQSDPELAFEDY